MLSAITEHEREEEIPVQSSHMDVEAGTGAHEEAQRAERLNFWQQEVSPPPLPPGPGPTSLLIWASMSVMGLLRA